MIRPRGFSLIEVVLAAVLLLTILTVISLTLRTNAEAAKFDMASNEAAHAGRKISQQVTRELMESGGDEFNNDWLTSHPFGVTTAAAAAPPFNTLSFRTRISNAVVAAANAADNWSTVITYSAQASPNEVPNNGTDDDNDGLVDEQALVRTQNGNTIVLDQNVLRFQVSRDAAANPDQIQLLIEVGRGYDVRPGEARRFVSRVFQTTVLIRNRPQVP